MTMAFLRKHIRLKNFDYSNGFVYFITICTFNKQPFFSDNKIASIIEDEIYFRVSKNEVTVYCYCIMPDHIHLLLTLSENYCKNLSNWVSAFKRYSAKVVNDKFNISKLWQINFYDHVVRKEESMQSIAEYILSNPVRKGLVQSREDYRFSKIMV